jgi:hypothetical protein
MEDIIMKHPCKAVCTNTNEPSVICEFGEANKIWVLHRCK